MTTRTEESTVSAVPIMAGEAFSLTACVDTSGRARTKQRTLVIDTPWKPNKTRQQEGMASEKRQAKKHGARLHPRSGAGSIKDDASNEEVVYEFKDAQKSHTLKAEDLDALFRRAAQQGKEAKYVVLFGPYELEATITLRRA